MRCLSKEGRLVDGWVRSSDKRGDLLDFKPFATDASVDDQGVDVEEGTPPESPLTPIQAPVAAEASSEPQDSAALEPAPQAEAEAKPS